MDPARDQRRRAILLALGAPAAAVDELLAYGANPFNRSRLFDLALPLADEPQVGAWSEYLADAQSRGVLAALAERLVPLRFPVEAGISQTEEYKAATRRGILPGDRPGLGLRHPDGLTLLLHPTAAGRIPILTVSDRRDFVSIVQACSCRNEPEPVPDSMGACIVAGLNNWDRVGRHRRQLETDRGTALTQTEWAAALKDLAPRKELYQDRFIILSRAPYSGVPAADVGLPQDEWLDRSLAIRLEHECTHYLTLRAFGVMRNNLLDEFIADFAGLAHAFHRYEAALFLRFLGLDAYPAVREGGRLGIYLGKPPLSPPAAEHLGHVVVRAANNLEEFAADLDLGQAGERAAVILALAGLTLEELAGDTAGRLLASNVASARSRCREP